MIIHAVEDPMPPTTAYATNSGCTVTSVRVGNGFLIQVGEEPAFPGLVADQLIQKISDFTSPAQ